MKAVIKFRQHWTTSVWLERTSPLSVKITAKRVMVGTTVKDIYDRFTGKLLGKFNPHTKPKVLVRVIDDDGKTILQTAAAYLSS